jgi:hypothetical protein
MSAVEAAANAAIGLLVSWTATYLLFPIWGFAPSPSVAAEITLTFFLLSFLRSWALREVFKWMT